MWFGGLDRTQTDVLEFRRTRYNRLFDSRAGIGDAHLIQLSRAPLTRRMRADSLIVRERTGSEERGGGLAVSNSRLFSETAVNAKAALIPAIETHDALSIPENGVGS